jgi:hypothetical protein
MILIITIVTLTAFGCGKQIVKNANLDCIRYAQKHCYRCLKQVTTYKGRNDCDDDFLQDLDLCEITYTGYIPGPVLRGYCRLWL